MVPVLVTRCLTPQRTRSALLVPAGSGRLDKEGTLEFSPCHMFDHILYHQSPDTLAAILSSCLLVTQCQAQGSPLPALASGRLTAEQAAAERFHGFPASKGRPAQLLNETQGPGQI